MLKIISTNELFKSRYTTFIEKEYIDKNGNQKKYHFIARTSNQKAAIIIPVSKDRKKILLIKQYRIPLEDFIIEFPAGLIEEGEPFENTAIRELKEETGFDGKILKVSPPVFSSPGLTTEEVVFVFTEYFNREKQKLEPSEIIEVIITDKNKWEEIKMGNYNIQSWVYIIVESFFNKLFGL